MTVEQVTGQVARIGLLVASVIWAVNAQGAVSVAPEMVALIEAAAAESYAVYPVDEGKEEALLGLVDKWAQSQVPLDDAHRIQGKSPDRTTWVTEQAANAPIFAKGENWRGLSPKRPFRIKYARKPEGRSFVKAIRMPSPRQLKEKEVVEIGRGFAEKQGFVAQTAADKIGGHLVVARRTDTMGSDAAKRETLTVLQRVIFKRSVDGLEVFNSRQIVDVHPDTREILAYKGLEWAPAREPDRKTVSSLPADDLLTAIKETFGGTSSLYLVTGVDVGMYQSEGVIFPVLAVVVERERDRPEDAPILHTLYLPLSEYGDVPASREPLRVPQTAR